MQGYYRYTHTYDRDVCMCIRHTSNMYEPICITVTENESRILTIVPGRFSSKANNFGITLSRLLNAEKFEKFHCARLRVGRI